jgi:predicted DNA-binding transcriptional regulator AlpA
VRQVPSEPNQAQGMATSAPIAVNASEAARLCGFSRGHWHRLDSAGLVPRPVRIGGGCPRWVVSDLAAWMEAGAPNRATWELRKRNGYRQAG